MEFELVELTRENCDLVRESIDREDIPLCFVHPVETIMNVTDYGVEHGLAGHTFAVKANGEYVGTILLGETIPWNTDPPQMREEPFYRIMGFVLDKRYRGLGIGGQVLERAIEAVYRDYGPRPIALGCHQKNVSAAAFYRRHGFIKTDYLETEDYYYLRYPAGWPTAPAAAAPQSLPLEDRAVRGTVSFYPQLCSSAAEMGSSVQVSPQATDEVASQLPTRPPEGEPSDDAVGAVIGRPPEAEAPETP